MPHTSTASPSTQHQKSSPSLRESLEDTLGPELAGALEKKGFERLTPVQEAVLAPALRGRDLRISSQTGSGKTVAIGFVLRDEIRPGIDAPADAHAHPRAIVVTPTRELAKQVEEELGWLYGPLGARVVSVTGGAGYRDELRAFRANPAIIVGTPGRLLDHLTRGAIDGSTASAIVLDEADRMLDMGFREDIEAIIALIAKPHRTHLVSATFPREVKKLADRVQVDPVAIEGTPLGSANADIEHLIHVVHPRERLAAIVNLLLESPGAQTLIFARTRADVAGLADALGDAGFTIAMLSGEMEQAERNRALAAFKRGNVDALVATDVAARGIDVQDVARVLHAEPPTDADAYTHRSGRTGRAGRKGTSSILATTSELARTTGLLGRARVRYRFAPIPTADAIRDARDERLLETLTAGATDAETADPRSLSIAERVLASSDPALAVARLVALATRSAQAEPRDVTAVALPTGPKGQRAHDARRERGARERDRRPGDEGPAAARPEGEWTAFRISWGEAHGADPRRLVAMMCRRGNIEGRDIGAIRVGRTWSVVEVSSSVAAEFERATAKPDPRDPRVHVRRWNDAPPSAHAAKEGPRVGSTGPRPVSRPPASPMANDKAAVPKDRASKTASKKSAHEAARPHASKSGPHRGGHAGRGGHAPLKRRRP